MTALRLISIDLFVNRLVADWQPTGNLLGTPLQAKTILYRVPSFWADLRRITAALRSFLCIVLRLAGTVPASSRAARQFATNGRFMPSQYLGNLILRLSCFHKRLNLITFGLAEVFIGHWASSTGRSGGFNAKASQPPFPLIKVALRR